MKAAMSIVFQVTPGPHPYRCGFLWRNPSDGHGIIPGVCRADFRIAKLFERKKRYYELPVADYE
jgi:hypothetical protein